LKLHSPRSAQTSDDILRSKAPPPPFFIAHRIHEHFSDFPPLVPLIVRDGQFPKVDGVQATGQLFLPGVAPDCRHPPLFSFFIQLTWVVPPPGLEFFHKGRNNTTAWCCIFPPLKVVLGFEPLSWHFRCIGDDVRRLSRPFCICVSPVIYAEGISRKRRALTAPFGFYFKRIFPHNGIFFFLNLLLLSASPDAQQLHVCCSFSRFAECPPP